MTQFPQSPLSKRYLGLIKEGALEPLKSPKYMLANLCPVAALAVGVKFLIGAYQEDTVPDLSLIHSSTVSMHYARITGVSDGLEQMGAIIPDTLAAKIHQARIQLAEMRGPVEELHGNVFMHDMIQSEGELEAMEGDWTVASLERYVDAILKNDPMLRDALRVSEEHLLENGVDKGTAFDMILTTMVDATNSVRILNGQVTPFEMPHGEDAYKHPMLLAELNSTLKPFLEERMMALLEPVFASLDQSLKIDDPLGTEQIGETDAEITELIEENDTPAFDI
jgi:hypothetical protein